MEIRVIRAGLLTTVQDAGRRGQRRTGMPSGGAADAFALRAANLLVGNPEGAAALEMTLIGPELEFSEDALVAVGGAEGASFPSWKPWRVCAGERVRFGDFSRGCRAVLAVAGGVHVGHVLGSASTCLRAELGGFQGRALREGDVIRAGPEGGAPCAAAPAIRLSPSILPAYSPSPTVRTVRGAQADDFGGALCGPEFRVTPRSDRMGVRLAGPRLSRSERADLVSTAVVPGTVQVPPDGQPIVLLADAQTIGGYPQAAHVITADLPLVAQLRPGEGLRFEEVSLTEAWRLLAARERDLSILRQGLEARR